MTIEEIIQSDLIFLRATDVAPILRCDAQQLRNEAHRVPCKLGFDVVVIGRRIRIPREAFLKYLNLI